MGRDQHLVSMARRSADPLLGGDRAGLGFVGFKELPLGLPLAQASLRGSLGLETYFRHGDALNVPEGTSAVPPQAKPPTRRERRSGMPARDDAG